jgi:hypothetical protein
MAVVAKPASLIAVLVSFVAVDDDVTIRSGTSEQQAWSCV